MDARILQKEKMEKNTKLQQQKHLAVEQKNIISKLAFLFQFLFPFLL